MIAIRIAVVILLLLVGLTPTKSQSFFSAPGDNAMHVANDVEVTLSFTGVVDSSKTGSTNCVVFRGVSSPADCREPAFIVIPRYYFESMADTAWDDFSLSGTYSFTDSTANFTSPHFSYSTEYVAISRNLWTIDTLTDDTTLNSSDTLYFRTEHPIPSFSHFRYGDGSKRPLFCTDTLALRFTSSIHNYWSGIDSIAYVATLSLDSSSPLSPYYSDSALACEYSISSDSQTLLIYPDGHWPVDQTIGLVVNLQHITGSPSDRYMVALNNTPLVQIMLIATRDDSSNLPAFTSDTVITERYLTIGDTMSLRVPEYIGDYEFDILHSTTIGSIDGAISTDTTLVLQDCDQIIYGSHIIHAQYRRRQGQTVTVLDSAFAITSVSRNDVTSGSGSYFLANDSTSVSSVLVGVTPPPGYHFVKWISNNPSYNNVTAQLLHIGSAYNPLYKNWWLRPDIGIDPIPGCTGPYTVCVESILQGYFYEFADGGVTLNDIVEEVTINGVQQNCATFNAAGQCTITVRISAEYASCFYIAYMSHPTGYRTSTGNYQTEFTFLVNYGPPACSHTVYVAIARKYKYLEVEYSDIDEESIPLDYKLRFNPDPLDEQSTERQYGYFYYVSREVEQDRIMHRVKYFCNQVVDVMPRYRDDIDVTAGPFREPPYAGTSFEGWECPTLPGDYYCPEHPEWKWLMDHVMNDDYTLANDKRLKHKITRSFVLEAIGYTSTSENRSVIDKWIMGPNYAGILSYLSNSDMSLGTSHLQLLFSKPVSTSSLESGGQSRIKALDVANRVTDCDYRDQVFVTYHALPSTNHCDLVSSGRVLDWHLKQEVVQGGLAKEKRTPKSGRYTVSIAPDLTSTGSLTIEDLDNLSFDVTTEDASLDISIANVGLEYDNHVVGYEGALMLIRLTRNGSTLSAQAKQYPGEYSAALIDNIEDHLTAPEREFEFDPTSYDIPHNPTHSVFSLNALDLDNAIDLDFVVSLIDLSDLCEDIMDEDNWPTFRSFAEELFTGSNEEKIRALRRHIFNFGDCFLGNADEPIAMTDQRTTPWSGISGPYGLGNTCNGDVFTYYAPFFDFNNSMEQFYVRFRVSVY